MKNESVILNKLNLTKRTKKEISVAFSDQSIIQSHGGYLLKAQLIDNILYLEIKPQIIEGIRQYHYEMTLPFEEGGAVSGFINQDSTLTILPLIDEHHLDKNLSDNELTMAKLLLFINKLTNYKYTLSEISNDCWDEISTL